MKTTELITLLLNLFSEYGPGLVKQVTDLINGNPQLAGESDDDYIARINAQIDSTLDDAEKKDKEVEAD